MSIQVEDFGVGIDENKLKILKPLYRSGLRKKKAQVVLVLVWLYHKILTHTMVI